MKRIPLLVLFACFSLTLAAQDEVIRVNYQGAKPTISDFVQAYIFAPLGDAEEEEDLWVDEATNAVKEAWTRHRDGVQQEPGVTLTIDQKNGFVLYESRYEETLLRIEMCYWNELDGKHRMFAYNVGFYENGRKAMGQYDGISFYRYDNAAKTMTLCDDTGFEQEFVTDDGANVSYALPRSGKDITVTYWYDDGTKRQKTLKWDGRRFSF